MFVVTVLPLGLELDVPADQTVMAAAHDAGYIWPTECGQAASCGLCVSIIREGVENCGEMPNRLSKFSKAEVERFYAQAFKQVSASGTGQVGLQAA